MCRTKGRRCPQSPRQRRAHNMVQKQSYKRRKARQRADAHAADLENAGLKVLRSQDIPDTPVTDEINLDEVQPGTFVSADAESTVVLDTSPLPPGEDAILDEVVGPDDETVERTGPQLVRARDGALVVEIDSTEDYENLLARYPHPTDEGELDYDAMEADGIHGVQITDKGAAELNLPAAEKAATPGGEVAASNGGDSVSGWAGLSAPKKAGLIILAGAMFTLVIGAIFAAKLMDND